MAFEAFLTETYARPRRGRVFGYLVSLGLHAPPTTAFVVAWLTHALVIGHAGEAPSSRRSEAIYYRVPLALRGHLGLGGDPGGGPDPGRAAPSDPLTGGSGALASRGRRTSPRRPNKIHPVTAPLEQPDQNWADFDPWREEGPEVLAGGGGGIAGEGIGRGASHGTGPGGLGGNARTPGGMLAAAITPPVVAPPRKTAKDEKPQGAATEGEGAGDGSSSPDGRIGALVDVPSSAGRPSVKAYFITEQNASYLRTHSFFPRCPEWCYSGGRRTHLFVIEVCVSPEGRVLDVNIKRGADQEINQILTNAIWSWRYRPRFVAGLPRAFCHPMRIEYSRHIGAMR